MSLKLHVTYMNNKRAHCHLKTNQSGGGDLNSNRVYGPITTYSLTLGSGRSFQKIKLVQLVPDLINIEPVRIGSFDVKDKIVIGDTDYNEIKTKPGRYTAYNVADSLMIIHDDLNINPKVSDVAEWEWTHSGTGVGVDGGQFGFYDLYAINIINKLLPTTNHNNLPYIGYVKTAAIVDGSLIEALDPTTKIDNKIKNLKPFGVIASTVTGDGGFECFVIGNQRAILLGGEANRALFDIDIDVDVNVNVVE